jgi:hypothetical protein
VSSPIGRNPAYVRARGVLGVLYIGLGLIIAVEILHRVGPRFEALPGVVLGVAMIALGIVRIRAALALRKAA